MLSLQICCLELVRILVLNETIENGFEANSPINNLCRESVGWHH
jgi:hypothetical protein